MRGSNIRHEGTAPRTSALFKAGIAGAAFLALVIALGIGHRLGRDDKRTTGAPAERAAAPEPTPENTREFVALSKELELVKARMRGLEERDSSPAEQPAEERDSAGAAPPSRPALDGATIQARFSEILEGDVSDGAGALTEERTIADFVSRAAVPGTRLEAVDCRSSLCRLQLHIDNESAGSAFRAHIGEAPLDRGGFFHIDAAAGTMTFFSPREGHSLPTLDPS